MHEQVMQSLYEDNFEKLFSHPLVNIFRCPFGERYIVTDSLDLFIKGHSGNPDKYHVLGLVPEAAVIIPNDTLSFDIALRGFSPERDSKCNADSFDPTNWKHLEANTKEFPGVLLKVYA